MSAMEGALAVQRLDHFQDGVEKLENLNGNVDMASDSSPILPLKEGRIFRKAKRLVKLSPKKDDEDSEEMTSSIHGGNQNGNRAPFAKNSRKSRDGRGRGLPKKGGAGGKGVWGAPGSELYETSECKDDKDPNYDSDSQDAFVVRKTEPLMTSEELVRVVEPILCEYLEHGDSSDVVDLLRELNIGPNTHKLPEVAVSLALDRHDPQRELISRLISAMYGYVSQDAMARGFDNILQSLKELVLDLPAAPELVGQFIARAIADDCLPPSFINHYKGKATDDHMSLSLDKAEVLLSMKHGIAHLDNIWGEGGANKPVKYLTNQMVLLLKEYLNSGEIAEATRCLKELEVPHFHHELVYNAAVIAIEDSSERATDMMVQLLKSLTASLVITPDMFTKGVHRLCDDMPDICLDVPSAYTLLDRLGNKLYAEGVINDDLMKEMPARGRKRFVSEGDGGKVKEQTLVNGH